MTRAAWLGRWWPALAVAAVVAGWASVVSAVTRPERRTMEEANVASLAGFLAVRQDDGSYRLQPWSTLAPAGRSGLAAAAVIRRFGLCPVVTSDLSRMIAVPEDEVDKFAGSTAYLGVVWLPLPRSSAALDVYDDLAAGRITEDEAWRRIGAFARRTA